MTGGLIIVAIGFANAGLLATIGYRHNRRYDARRRTGA